jgi:hypothetical protein
METEKLELHISFCRFETAYSQRIFSYDSIVTISEPIKNNDSSQGKFWYFDIQLIHGIVLRSKDYKTESETQVVVNDLLKALRWSLIKVNKNGN